MPTLLNSLVRNEWTVLAVVFSSILIRTPSSTPSRCGMISLGSGGSLSTPLLNSTLPLGESNIMSQYGFEIAVCFMYSSTDCLFSL